MEFKIEKEKRGKSLLLIFLFLFPVFWGYSKSDICRIEGNVLNLDEGKVYLRDIWSGENLDTAEAANGRFTFVLKVKEPVYVAFVYKGNSVSQFFIEAKPLTLTGDVKNTTTFVLTGSTSQTQWLKFSEQWQGFLESYFSSKGVRNFQLPDTLWFSFQHEASSFLKPYFSQNKTTSIAAFSLIQTGNYLSPEVKNEIWKAIPSKARKGRYAKTFEAITENENRFLGEFLMDFHWKDISGKMVQNKDFKGKFLLIDFWASWCKPCRQYNVKFKALYAELKGEGFEILSYSLDADSVLFEKALQEDNMPWTQVHDKNGWETAFIKHYKIQGLPSNLLIGPDGKILAKNVKPERIIAWIRK